MSEMIGNASDIGPYKTSDVAVLVFILIELTMGLFVMEALRVTRIFPNIGSMDDKMRRRIMWIAFSLLTILAGLGSALALASDRFAWHLGVFSQSMPDTEQPASVGMLPAVVQMIMGFIFPFALVLAAIPLASFVSSCRTVLGIIAVGALRLIVFGVRLVGNIGYYAGRFVINLYDLLIFPTIWLEGVLASPKTNKNVGGGHQLYNGRRITEVMIDRE
jgi:hypothetical protein